MKGRESGMPEEDWWSSFFDAQATIDLFVGSSTSIGNVVEFGSGYGTFTVPMARRCFGTLTALDIEPDMVECSQRQAQANQLFNVKATMRDFVAHGTGLESGSQAHAMIYNLLHIEHPLELLREAHRVLADGGALSVMHWRSDITTPRGPTLDIRPTPEKCQAWLQDAGFRAIKAVNLQGSCPYHFGLLAYADKAGKP